MWAHKNAAAFFNYNTGIDWFKIKFQNKLIIVSILCLSQWKNYQIWNQYRPYCFIQGII